MRQKRTGSAKQRPCPYCGATGDEPDWPTLQALLRDCTNCLLNIAYKGHWTGDGWRAVQRFKERMDKGEVKGPTVQVGGLALAAE